MAGLKLSNNPCKFCNGEFGWMPLPSAPKEEK